jgi:hypothetical protein
MSRKSGKSIMISFKGIVKEKIGRHGLKKMNWTWKEKEY